MIQFIRRALRSAQQRLLAAAAFVLVAVSPSLAERCPWPCPDSGDDEIALTTLDEHEHLPTRTSYTPVVSGQVVAGTALAQG
jgi:hypothetical protein